MMNVLSEFKCGQNRIIPPDSEVLVMLIIDVKINNSASVIPSSFKINTSGCNLAVCWEKTT